MKAWTVYKYKNKYIIPTIGRTSAGFRMEIDPVVRIDCDNVKELECTICNLISKSIAIVNTPDFEKKYVPVVVKTAGEVSWSKFANKSSAWRIESENESWSLVPLVLGEKNAFLDDVQNAVVVTATTSHREIAERIVKILVAA